MNISSNGKVLLMATKELSVKWEQTKTAWHDSKSQEFERKYLIELTGSVDRAMGIFEQLDKLVNKIRTDCE